MQISGEDTPSHDGAKSVFRLDRFIFFDPRNLHHVSLDGLSDETSGLHCEGIGYVSIVYDDDEDFSPENRPDGGNSFLEPGEDDSNGMGVRVRLGAIMRLHVDYTDEHE